MKQILTAIILCLTLLTGCNTTQTQEQTLNLEQLQKDITIAIQSGSNVSSEYIESSLEISSFDRAQAFNVNNIYYNDNTVYMQISISNTHYMYRFTLNENNKIDSYIKYYLEA